ncbi:MAG: hypothetical protein CBC35_08535 [Planctomycetes bacterium TMED75]|nr:hypothetical protein [Planctomycetaceae bacterium]OUU91880.1 MAG: hypothetical protein CBC35_08535 [Planctomycetes bacterium TMED75]
MAKANSKTFRGDFRRFFVKGLAVLLPTVLTLWILVKAYEFVDVAIAQPINSGIRLVMNQATPHVGFLQEAFEPTQDSVDREMARIESENRGKKTAQEVKSQVRAELILRWWEARWYMNFIGLFVAILAVYIAGRLLGGFLGRGIYNKLESLITTIPGIKQVYPYVKQVVDFLFSDEKPINFNQVVLVQYPRKGVWAVGLVTGSPMKSVQNTMAPDGETGLTIFIPSSPTPFTGYTISVPQEEVVELPITIDEALRFTISGGVLIPSHETIGDSGGTPLPEAIDSEKDPPLKD